MNENSKILTGMLTLLYPIILIFGAYIVLNGSISPGGGFQGGAVLASVFICKYIVSPVEDFEMITMQKYEKLLYIIIVLIPTFFIILGFKNIFPSYRFFYITLMNVLIGLKVALGLSFIFFRFVFYESR